MEIQLKHIVGGVGVALASSFAYKLLKAKELAEQVQVDVSVKPKLEASGLLYKVQVNVSNPTEHTVVIGKPNVRIRATGEDKYFASTLSGPPETVIKPLETTIFYIQLHSSWQQLGEFAGTAIAQAKGGALSIDVHTTTPVEFIGKYVEVKSEDTYMMKLPELVTKLIG